MVDFSNAAINSLLLCVLSCQTCHCNRRAFTEESDASETPRGLLACSQSMWKKICDETRQINSFIFSSMHLNACVSRPQSDGTAFRFRQAACAAQWRAQNVAQPQVAGNWWCKCAVDREAESKSVEATLFLANWLLTRNGNQEHSQLLPHHRAVAEEAVAAS